MAYERCISFWATDYRCLNDPYEINYLYQCLCDALQDYENRNQLQSKSPFLKATFQQWLLWKSPYVFSLSECIDSLSLWRLYGDQGRGVAIALDRSELLNKLPSGPGWYAMKKIDYQTESEVRAMFDDVTLQALYQEIDPSQSPYCPIQTLSHNDLSLQACYLKTPAYRDEREWRISRERLNDHFQEVNFREKNGLIIPYIDIDIPLSCVKQIIIGPREDQRLCASSIGEMLRKYAGYYQIDVLLSSLPYVCR